MRNVQALGGEPTLRMAVNKDGPVITDQGNMVLDIVFKKIFEPYEMEKSLNNIPGLLENGLFVGLATEVLIGRISSDGQIKVEARG